MIQFKVTGTPPSTSAGQGENEISKYNCAQQSAKYLIICELCDIRDGNHLARNIISKAEVCNLLDILCTA